MELSIARTADGLQTAWEKHHRFSARGCSHDADTVCLRVCEALRPLVCKFVRRLSFKHVTFDELVACANTAIAAALLRYDPGHGTTFKTFVYTAIQGNLYNYLRANGGSVIKLPAWLKDALPKARRFIEALPTDAEIPLAELARLCKLTAKQAATLVQFLDHDARVISFGAVDTERNPAFAAGWQERCDNRLILEQYLGRLPPDTASLLRRVYFDREPIVDVAAQEGITRQAIDQRLRTALGRLRQLIPAGTF